MAAYDAAVADDQRAQDLERLDGLIRSALPDFEVRELDRGGTGYGPFHYRYASGREGDAFRVSVVRKTGISLYVLAMTADGEYLAEARAAEFPKATVGRACVRLKRLDDLDERALRSLLEDTGRLLAPGAA